MVALSFSRIATARSRAVAVLSSRAVARFSSKRLREASRRAMLSWVLGTRLVRNKARTGP